MLKFPPDFKFEHVSPSALRTYLMCGYRWAYEYIGRHEGAMDSPGWDARLRGKAVDEAVTAHFKLKAIDGKGLTDNQCADIAVATHDQHVDTHMFKVPQARSRERVARIARVYRQTFGETFQPRSAEDVQKKMRVKHPLVHLPIVGVADVITNLPMVVDNKVMGKVPTQRDVDRDLQLTTYAMQSGVSQVALAVVTDEDNPRPILIPSRRSKEQMDAMADRYNQMIKGVKSRALQPAPEKSWYCCHTWCAFYQQCPHGAALDGEQVIAGMDE